MAHRSSKDLNEEVRCLLDQLGLRDWDVGVSKTKKSSKTNYAHIEIPIGQKRAVIVLGKAFHDLSREGQREVLVHELIHCHFDPIEKFINNALDGSVDEAAALALHVGMRHFIEFGVDGLATAISHLLSECGPGDELGAGSDNPVEGAGT